MKSFIAYALVVIGVPVLFGLLFGAVISFPIARLLQHKPNFRITNLLYLEVFNGFGAVLAATLLFYLFSLPLNLAVLFIMGGWVTIYFLSYCQSKIALISSLGGMVIGWFLIPYIQSQM